MLFEIYHHLLQIVYCNTNVITIWINSNAIAKVSGGGGGVPKNATGSWSDGAPPPTATTTELWGAPMGKTSRGPPPGLGASSSQQQKNATGGVGVPGGGGNPLNGWMGSGSGAGRGGGIVGGINIGGSSPWGSAGGAAAAGGVVGGGPAVPVGGNVPVNVGASVGGAAAAVAANMNWTSSWLLLKNLTAQVSDDQALQRGCNQSRQREEGKMVTDISMDNLQKIIHVWCY